MGIWGDYREGRCGNGFPSSFDVEFMDVGLQEGLIRRLDSRHVDHQYLPRRGKTPVETTIIQPQVGRPINLVIYPSSRASRIPKRLPSDSLSPRVPPPCPMISREGPHSVIAQNRVHSAVHSFIELLDTDEMASEDHLYEGVIESLPSMLRSFMTSEDLSKHQSTPTNLVLSELRAKLRAGSQIERQRERRLRR
jgi:hypothetical protein